MTTVFRGRTATRSGAGVVLVVTAAAFTWPWGFDKVAMPADGTGAAEVVATYLAALNAHDCDTAAALAAESFASIAREWCGDVASLGDIRVGDGVDEDPSWTGLPARSDVVSVPATFDLDWLWLRSDGSMPEGATAWGYRLTRSAPEAPWRITDNGLG
ncbi:hypothetical protein [Demequina sp. NBRC 110055]|uniref:hypothetical protein n=1 Tax=Demequina sp. NBRC 110055 TaxID=1570344 RepID=UPI000A024E31|nr:hypothetical protein [Demequina sp. NBRC 110055]